MPLQVKIGTRGSQLALWQANWVKDQLERHHPELQVALEVIKTRGDKILDVPLARVGGKGLFVKEIEEAILDRRVDLAVHSMKDMPAEIPAGLTIGAVPEREDPGDVLIARQADTLEALPRGARIGTSSLRRSAQLLHRRPDFQIVALRGNLDTRLKKLHTANLDAIVLAAAGVRRLGLADHITAVLEPDVMLPAVGQGALCIEARAADPDILPLLAVLAHPATSKTVEAERAFLQRLEGGCQVPIAGHAVWTAGPIELTGLVADVNGRRILRDVLEGPSDQPAALGRRLAQRLLDRGAAELLARLKEEFDKNEIP